MSNYTIEELQDKSNKWRTKDGQEVIIYCVHKNGQGYPLHGAVKSQEDNEWNTESWELSGDYLVGASGCGLDLVKVNPYEDFKVDEPVMVWDEKCPDVPRHFSHEKGGKAYCFADGQTSHTTDRTLVWRNCVKVADYENN
ncbi:hypothetical protein ACOI22_03580 [Glaciecola sp. 2405UD65-10]|uniref:hypothetical protein n=1 Tax=Glaciecola sp. 2405UD65-10 TaxID=3397244 RepID=UPI003B5B7D68